MPNSRHERWPSAGLAAPRAGCLAIVALCSVSLAGCKRKPPPPVAAPESADDRSVAELAPGPQAAPSARPVAARCGAPSPANAFVIGDVSASPRQTEEDDAGGPDQDDEVPAPFSVELGPARSDGAGFVVSALRALKGQAHALVALLPADTASGKLVDLGPVHGDPDPPQFARLGPDLVLLVPDTDAGGTMLKLALVRDAEGTPKVSYGPEITGVRHDSTFALEVSGKRALLAYASEVAGKIRVYGALVDPANMKNKLSPEPLSGTGADVDSPRLALRQGGYWLAVARALDAPKSKPTARPSDKAVGAADDDSLLDLGTRRIELTKLDAQGKAASAALVVTAPGARPMTFDLAAAADGGAFVAFRGDDSTPGADGGALELVHVKADGSLENLTLDGETNGTGTPSLLVDHGDPSRVWLTAAGENGATLFGLVGEHTPLSADSFVRGADLIAAQSGQFLLARAKNTAVELSLVHCSAGATP